MARSSLEVELRRSVFRAGARRCRYFTKGRSPADYCFSPAGQRLAWSMVSVAEPEDAVPLTGEEHLPQLFGHPRGLWYLSFTEAWERFSYYGMQTLLVLYMIHQLLLPGHVENIIGFGPLRDAIAHGRPLSNQQLASSIFGWYAGLVYLTPILGGILADRLLGRTRTIVTGALLMATGHFLMAFDQPFLIALLCL